MLVSSGVRCADGALILGRDLISRRFREDGFGAPVADCTDKELCVESIAFADIEQRHIGRAIAMQAQAIGERPFLLADAALFSFSEVNRRVNELAAGAGGAGIDGRRAAGLLRGKRSEVIFPALAAESSVPCGCPSTEYKGDWLEDTIRRSRPRILVTDTQHARVADARERLALEHLLVHGGSSERPEAEELATVAAAGALEPDMSGFSAVISVRYCGPPALPANQRGAAEPQCFFQRGQVRASSSRPRRAMSFIWCCPHNTAAWADQYPACPVQRPAAGD
ncbi:MAG: hypothetical protein IPF49_15110 [Gammaproteobacteria bacterium]|nr:hypothetical protein [Gammaproteobacteria bacterium]